MKGTKLLPREKIERFGAEMLTDRELVQALLGSGTANMPIERLAPKILECIERYQEQIKYDDLKTIHGMGSAKIAIILAAFELSRRLIYCEKKQIRFPADVLHLVMNFADRQQEHFIVILLNGAHESLRLRVVSIGSLNEAIVHPREVFSEAVRLRAASVILAHNHPSGNVQPSEDDFQSTKRLVACGKLLGIEVLDHIIFSVHTYYSFAEHNKMSTAV